MGQNVQRSSRSPSPSGPRGHAASPPAAPASRRVSHPSVGSRSACGHKRASWDRFICADESNDAAKARDWSRGESLRPGLPGSEANTLNAPSAPSSGAFVAGESMRGLSFLHLYSHILSRRTPPLSPSRTAGPARPSSPSSPLAV